MRDHETPFACNLAAMTSEERERHRVLGEKLRGSVTEIRELPDGFMFRIPEEAWTTAAEFVALERLCCPFLRFRLEWTAEQGPIWLSLTGAEGTKEFLRVELSLPPRDAL